MARVPARPLSKKVWEQIGGLLVAEIARARSTSQTHALATTLLGPTEHVVLAKRFAIAVLLEEGAPYSYIRRVLNVSTSTVARVQHKRLEGTLSPLLKQYHHVLRRARGSAHSTWQGTPLEALMRGGLPPMASGRWRYVFRHDNPPPRKKR